MRKHLKKIKDRVDKFNGSSPKIVGRIWTYTAISLFATFLDYVIFFSLIKLFDLYYLVAVTFSFLFANTLNYYFSWKFSFSETQCSAKRSYILFLMYGMIGTFLTIILLGSIVSKTEINLLFSRIIVSLIVGAVGFIFNYFFSFRMHKHLKTDFSVNPNAGKYIVIKRKKKYELDYIPFKSP